MFLDFIDPKTGTKMHKIIIKKLCQNNFPTFIVGGAVRDLLSGNFPNDFDIATKATPEEISRIFSDVKIVGESFGVTLVNNIEVATFRTDIHHDIGDKNCTTKFAKTIEEDLSRRDFTINSLAFCEFSGNVIDLFNGKKDLKDKIIKFVGDPLERIKEDPNRIIRACRFLAKINGEFDAKTHKALKNNSHLISSHVAPERIRKEIMKAMEIPNASLFFKALFSIDALKHIFPELNNAINHDHGKFHKENIFEHNMITGDSISCKFPLIKLAGFLHDIGKPKSFNEGHFIGHEKEGELILKNNLRNLKFFNEEINFICSLVRLHMHSMKTISNKGIRKLLKKLFDKNLFINDFLRLKIADRKANLNKNNFTFTEIKEMKKLFLLKEEIPFNVKSLSLTGGEIISLFNLKASPEIGKIQNFLLNFVLDTGINKKEILIEKVEEFL